MSRTDGNFYCQGMDRQEVMRQLQVMMQSWLEREESCTRTLSHLHHLKYRAVLLTSVRHLSRTGEPDRLPVRPQVAITDHWAGFNASAAILAALVARKSTGKGVHIDVSMFDCQVKILRQTSLSTLY